MSDGFIGHGTTIEYNPDPLTPAAFTTLAQVRSFSGLALEADDVDITNYQSPDGFREFIAGLKDPGEADLEIVYVKGEASKAMGLQGLRTGWRITLPDNPGGTGSTLTFTGYVKTVNWEIPVDDAITSGVTLRAASNVVFTPFT